MVGHQAEKPRLNPLVSVVSDCFISGYGSFDSRMRIPKNEINISAPPSVATVGRTASPDFGQDEMQFCLANLWTLHHVVESAAIEIEGHKYNLLAGALTLIPPGVVYKYRHSDFRGSAFIHFTPSPSRVTSFKQQLPLIHQPVGSPKMMDELINIITQASQPVAWQQSAALWMLLCRIHMRTLESGMSGHKTTDKLHHAVAIIHNQLSQTLTVATIAQKAGCSAAHLSRMFQRNFGLSAQEYIRKEKARHAARDLAFSNKTLKEIAFDVGIFNLQQFNKLIRNEFGVSPSALRMRYAMPTKD